MMNAPRIYYHAFLCGDHWKRIVQDHMLKLYTSGLIERVELMTIGASSYDKENIKWLRDLWRDFRNVIIVEHSQSSLDKEERATLLLMKEWTDSQSGETPILYFHTKGATRPDYTVHLWSKFMEYYNIDKWRTALSILESGKVTYGVNLKMTTADLFEKDYPHYSGNFWWARSSYIKTLDKDLLEDSNRWKGEFWIGSGGQLEKMHNEFESGVDHYVQEFSPNNYIKPIEIF